MFESSAVRCVRRAWVGGERDTAFRRYVFDGREICSFAGFRAMFGASEPLSCVP